MERLEGTSKDLRTPETAGSGDIRLGGDPVTELKFRLHKKLLEQMDVSKLAGQEPAELRRNVEEAARTLLAAEEVALPRDDRLRLIEEVADEVLGLGPLEPLLADPTITEIMVNGHDQVYFERKGVLAVSDRSFRDDEHVMRIIEKIVAPIGRRIDESSPMVDARLPDGSRVNAIIPPLAIDGPLLSIRRFGRSPLGVDQLVRNGSLTDEMAAMLRTMVRARLNILISGGTGSGKTTLLNCLSSFIPNNERIITVEDSAELQLQQPHVARLETRPANVEGRGEVTQRDLVRNTLRMRPDRIILGEVRGAESLDMLQAMNTGHDGSISTVHANSPRDALVRLEMMIMMGGFEIPLRAMRQQIALALDAIVQTARMADGTRKVTAISEVVGIEGDTITLQDLFVFKRDSVRDDGRIDGHFESSGVRPHFADQIKSTGHAISAEALSGLQS
jgi:pilus assembly protein CpaF